MIAWQKSNPRRVVQLFAPGAHAYALDSATIVATGTTATTGTLVQLPPTVLFIDGDGALYGGVSTAQDISVTPSTTPCSTSDANLAVTRVNFTCTQADFTVAFDATTSLNPLVGLFAHDSVAATASTAAAPSHHLVMASQPVRGAHLEVPIMCGACSPGQPGAPPPVTVPQRDSLTATLSAAVGSDLTFTFTVKNTRSTSVDVHFNDGQQYDFRVWNDKGVLVWHWAADKGFTEALVTRTLAPGESVSYVEHWTPPAAGQYRRWRTDQLLPRGGGVHDRLGALSHS